MNAQGAAPIDESGTVFYIGQHESQRTDPVSPDVLAQAQALGYDFVATPLTTPAFHWRVQSQVREYKRLTSHHTAPRYIPLPSLSPLTPADSTLGPQESNSALPAFISPWIDLGSRDPVIASISRQVLNIEVAYAAFCGMNNLILRGPSPDADVVQFARDLREALALGPYVHLHLLLPMIGDLEESYGELANLSDLATEDALDNEEALSDNLDPFYSWKNWNTIRGVCGYSQKLSIALEISRQLPAPSLQNRWLCEPVRLLVMQRTTFLRNAKGYPVLSKQHQQLLSGFASLRLSIWMLLCDLDSTESTPTSANSTPPIEPTPAEAATKARDKPREPMPHLRYIRYLQQNQPSHPPIEVFGKGYEDFLQSPLQPLTDNLESMTYEGFEKDPVKYEWYERAIEAALKDLHNIARVSPPIIVAIVGAGRGPLVTRALQASRKTGIQIQCWAVEKNPNAFVALQRRNATDYLWDNQVHVIKSDMRHWVGPKAPEGTAPVDILVSELLGSFADNELSPECLDGVQHLLHSEHGISIPQSYTAHLTPISTPRIHSDLLTRPGSDKWELPYVVMLQRYDFLAIHTGSVAGRVADVKQAWSFSHPLPRGILEHARRRAGGSIDSGGSAGGDGSNEHNARACGITFKCAHPGVCHGLAGYFESVLYSGSGGTVELSINPVTMQQKSEDMISWFPIFFPLKAPLYIPENSEIKVSMWRQTDDRSVWYEWLVEVFGQAKGRKTLLAMSDLHSSRKNACLT